jgi:hypothetical protein
MQKGFFSRLESNIPAGLYIFRRLEHAASVLRKMQEKGRDKEPAEREAQERKAGGQGRVPELLNEGFQDRRLNPVSFLFF